MELKQGESMNRNLPVQSRLMREPWFSFQDDFRDLMNRFDDFSDWSRDTSLLPVTNYPRIDLQDQGKNYLVVAEVPGMTEDDVTITLNENILTLEGEKKSEFKDEGTQFYRSEISYGKFYRSIPLSEDVDENKVHATYKDGILKITLAKKEGVMSKIKKIAITRGKHDQSSSVKQ
jgi:HSP20 family protein